MFCASSSHSQKVPCEQQKLRHIDSSLSTICRWFAWFMHEPLNKRHLTKAQTLTCLKVSLFCFQSLVFSCSIKIKVSQTRSWSMAGTSKHLVCTCENFEHRRKTNIERGIYICVRPFKNTKDSSSETLSKFKWEYLWGETILKFSQYYCNNKFPIDQVFIMQSIFTTRRPMALLYGLWLLS